MELTETIDSLNKQLADLYGVDTVTGQPMWRIVWSEDQFEHRLGTYDDYSPAGLYLRTVTEVRWVPKYRQWIKKKYVLEHLVAIPDANMPELPATKTSYEPIYPFQTTSKKYLPPTIQAAKFAIELIHAAMGSRSDVAKYKDPYAGKTMEECHEMKVAEIDSLQEELFGNESYVGDALAHKEAIIVPRNFEKRTK